MYDHEGMKKNRRKAIEIAIGAKSCCVRDIRQARKSYVIEEIGREDEGQRVGLHGSLGIGIVS